MVKAQSALAAFILLINCCQLIFCYDDNNFYVPKTPHFPSIDINEICDGVFFEARPFPGNNNFFVGCIRGAGVILQCLENELFDENQLKCVIDEGITTTTTPPDYNELCTGYFFDFIEYPNDCGKAIFCFNEEAVVRECPEGTIFDRTLEDCRSGNRDTCEFNNMPPATNVPVETTTEPDLTDVCNGVDFGFIEHPTDCGLAIFCFNQEKLLRECPENQIFDINIGLCRPGNRYTCEFTDDTTATPPDWGTICYGKEFEFIEHPTDCGMAIFCFDQNPILRECPENTIFDISIENCREGNRDTCLFSRQNRNVSGGGGYRNLCEGLQDALIPHEMDLRKFYRCADGSAYSLKCDYNEVFDTDMKNCKVNPEGRTSKENSMKNFQIIILLAFLCHLSEAQNPCSGKLSGRVAHPSDCHKYYLCAVWIPIEQSCNNNEIFNAASLTCITGNPETCEPYEETSTSEAPTTIQTTTTIEEIVSTTNTAPPSSIEEICRNVFFGARPHPDSNTLYIGCIRGDGMIFQCFSNEIFNKTVNECTEECKVNTNICAGVRLDLIAHPCDCARYIVCYNEAILEDLECGPNEIFSVDDKDCRPGNSLTCQLYTENTAPTIPTPTFSSTESTESTTTSFISTGQPTPPTPPAPSNPCENIRFGNVANESDCQRYYRCFNYQPLPETCAEGHHFDSTLATCIEGDDCYNN